MIALLTGRTVIQGQIRGMRHAYRALCSAADVSSSSLHQGSSSSWVPGGVLNFLLLCSKSPTILNRFPVLFSHPKGTSKRRHPLKQPPSPHNHRRLQPPPPFSSKYSLANCSTQPQRRFFRSSHLASTQHAAGRAATASSRHRGRAVGPHLRARPSPSWPPRPCL